MLKNCKYCGKQYEGDPGSSCCPDCAAAQRSTTIRDRICRTCGVVFPGGPRAWYCPTCRAERQRKANREHKARERANKVRKLGSTDYCIICGKPYTVTGGLQRYCPDCAPDAVRELDNEASKVWNRANTTADESREVRNAASAEIPCVVCGKLFVPHSPALTCSKECARALEAKRHAEYERQHREERNKYHRERITEKKRKGEYTMKALNYYVIGGQYHFYCYGGSPSLRGAKLIAAKHDEHWDNWQGWHRPGIYAAEDCVLADTEFYGEQMVPKPGTFPVATYDMDLKRWKAAEEI